MLKYIKCAEGAFGGKPEEIFGEMSYKTVAGIPLWTFVACLQSLPKEVQ